MYNLYSHELFLNFFIWNIKTLIFLIFRVDSGWPGTWLFSRLHPQVGSDNYGSTSRCVAPWWPFGVRNNTLWCGLIQGICMIPSRGGDSERLWLGWLKWTSELCTWPQPDWRAVRLSQPKLTKLKLKYHQQKESSCNFRGGERK